MEKLYLHEHRDFRALINKISTEKSIIPQLVEKDYWIMHCLHSLNNAFDLELKGGTSLSKGFEIIKRFSEDIDIKILPEAGTKVSTGKNQNKDAQIKSRRDFFDDLARRIKIKDIEVERDVSFDDEKLRNAGIRLKYKSYFPTASGVKSGILLELGFSQTIPNEKRSISSWALKEALAVAGLKDVIFDNEAKGIKCYHPGYTLIEKMEGICRKYRQFKEKHEMPPNFLRHYYDIYSLVNDPEVTAFIGRSEYRKYKAKIFSDKYEQNISKNEAIVLNDMTIRSHFANLFNEKRDLYFDRDIDFNSIIEGISKYLTLL